MSDQSIYRGEAGTLSWTLDYDTAGELTGKTVAAKFALPGSTSVALSLSATVTGTTDYTLTADYTEANSTSLTGGLYQVQLVATEGTDDTVLGEDWIPVLARIA